MTRATTRLARLALIVVAMMLATIALGWIGPVFVAVVLGAIDGRKSVAAESGLAAALAWTLVILFTTASAGTRPVGTMSAALGMPALVLSIATILFAAGLAWSAATLVLFVRRTVFGRRAIGDPDAPSAG